jgi:hypothetical protein
MHALPGIHRGLGVHISFVRSVPMDKWTDEQITVMKVWLGHIALALNLAVMDYLAALLQMGGNVAINTALREAGLPNNVLSLDRAQV